MLPPNIISMIMVVREVMNLSSNQLMSIISIITQISHKLSLLYLFPNKHRSKKLAIPIISIRTDHLPYSCIVTLKWNVLSSGTESKLFFFLFFSEKTNQTKFKNPAASPEWLLCFKLLCYQSGTGGRS
ncbi:hypothetical protein ATANTOWER_022671 [Ataeniobius toweri]|uniref:Uncharacterized protein n=1 Tax=Ataeniobius toweri TaxID=208326 RepID=A0ABU7CJ26_9TELE|nr:hypothetical protein [Ataeniobius toweri]